MGGNSGMIAGAFSSVSGKADKTLDTNGQILYYNSGRQALNIGSANQVLTVSGSNLPSWAAASGGKLELIENYTEGDATQNSKDFDVTEDPDDFSCLILEYSIGVDGAGDLNMQLNSNTGAGEYEINGTRIDGGSESLVNASSTSAEICPSEILSSDGNTGCGRVAIYLTEAGTTRPCFTAIATGQNTAQYYSIAGVNFVAETSITKITISMDANNWKQNSNFTLYRCAK
tara:strand:- start:137 stop:826 length:690 start_codon:yes stop_codon:yes gene_type:complete